MAICRFSVKPSKSILSVAQCVAVTHQKNWLARFLNKRAEMPSNPVAIIYFFMEKFHICIKKEMWSTFVWGKATTMRLSKMLSISKMLYHHSSIKPNVFGWNRGAKWNAKATDKTPPQLSFKFYLLKIIFQNLFWYYLSWWQWNLSDITDKEEKRSIILSRFNMQFSR